MVGAEWRCNGLKAEHSRCHLVGHSSLKVFGGRPVLSCISSASRHRVTITHGETSRSLVSGLRAFHPPLADHSWSERACITRWGGGIVMRDENREYDWCGSPQSSVLSFVFDWSQSLTRYRIWEKYFCRRGEFRFPTFFLLAFDVGYNISLWRGVARETIL